MNNKLKDGSFPRVPLQKPSSGIVILILVIFGIAALIAYNLWNRMVADAIRSNDIKSGLVAKVILEHEKATIGTLRAFAAQSSFIEAFKNRDMKATLWHFENLIKNNEEIDTIFVADPAGTLWVNYPISKESWNKNLSYRDWYKGVSREWKPYVSAIYKMIIGEKDLCVSVCVPVFDENQKVIGILNASQMTGFFQKVINEIGTDVDSKITLIDQDGQVIFSNRFPYKKEVIKFPDFPFVKKALAEQKGNAEIRDSSDYEKSKFMSFAPVEGHGWSVIVEKAKGDIFAGEYEVFVVVAGIACLAGLLVLVSGSFFRLREKQISEMAKLNQELDSRVKERTAALATANEELWTNEERLKLALDAGGMGTWDWYFDTGNIIWNERHYLLLGYQPGELTPSYEAWGKRVHPKDLSRVEALLRQKQEEAGEYSAEYRILWPDGTEHWVEARGRYECNEAGKAKRCYGVLAEITDRKRAEEALKKAKEELETRVQERTEELTKSHWQVQRERQRFYDVLETLPAMICLLTPDYHVAFSNRSFRERFGEANGRHCYEYCFGRTGPCEFCQSYKVLETGQPHHWEVKIPDGTGVIDAYDFPFTDVDGLPLILEMDIDITEHRRTEAALRERTEELAKSQNRLQNLSSQLLLAQEKERKRVAVELHDGLLSELAGVKYMIEARTMLWEQGKAPDLIGLKRISDILATVIKEARGIMNNLHPSVLDELGLIAAIKWVSEEYQKSYPHIRVQKKIEVKEQDIAESLRVVIYRILQEALNNFAKHGKGDRVDLSLSKANSALTLTILDNGQGFDVETVQKGLGLESMRERAELSGGEFQIESAIGRGTTIRIIWSI